MTKSTAKPVAAPAEAAQPAKTKTVLTERDMLPKGAKTQAEQKAEMQAELRRDRAALAKRADEIKAVNKAADKTIVVSFDGRNVQVAKDKLTADLRKLLKVGGSFAAVANALGVKAVKPALADGLTARTAPHSSKAIADDRASAKPASSAAKPASAKGKLPVKGADDNAAIKLTDKGEKRLKDGEKGSNANLSIMAKAGTVGKAIAVGLKRGDVNYAAKTGLITIG